MKYILISLLFLTPLTCAKPDTVTFTIKQGQHYSQGGRTIRQADLRAFRFYVDSSWLHTEVNAGWNKLICGVRLLQGQMDGIGTIQHRAGRVGDGWYLANG